MRANRRPNTGFTLVELLITMAILGLLLALSLPRYFGKLQDAKDAVLREDLRVMRQALDHFAADRGRYPDSLQELESAHYLDVVPIDPLTESRTSWRLTQSSDVDKPGISNINSGAEGASRDGAAYVTF